MRDFTNRGGLDDAAAFAEFIAEQDFTSKIVIAGNHDFCFEDERHVAAESHMRDLGVVYLNDSGFEIDGIHFWGSPVQPEFMDWAFNRARGAEIRRHWDLIPQSTDVLITHGPPMGILDVTYTGMHVGCEALLDSVHKIQPKIHVFGHIHESYGVVEKDDIKFVNACNCNHSYSISNPPIVLNI